MKKPRMIAPPWMIGFFFVSHITMWIVSFLQTFYIIYKIKEELRVLLNK